MISCTFQFLKAIFSWMRLKASHGAIFTDRVLLCVWQETGFSHDIPTTLQRSKADCPVPEVLLYSFTFAKSYILLVMPLDNHAILVTPRK